ncbi:MAG: DUF3863 domain-containing protein [Candidatus Lokiarchaeota archaeon]|nr:DUF3863 domain-containing protein [Candidatus Lokiarchaeota archaeon]
MKERFLTINCIVRKHQIEKTRTEFEGNDETELHDTGTVGRLAKIIRDGFPDAKITWALSWCALTDASDRYRRVRALLGEFMATFGDDVTFIPGGYFANRYNTREQVNKDVSDAARIIEQEFGRRPRSLVAGFLSAANIKHAREQEGIIGIQGNIWSQYSVDNMDGDGSVCYPYYPSTQHFCKPAQGPRDFIDCLNFDGWTVDFHNARLVGCRSRKKNSRMGVGPIETLGNLGLAKGLAEMKATTAAHYEASHPTNPFTWVANTIEVALVRQIPAIGGITSWLSWVQERWPDVQCPTLAGLAAELRSGFPDNDGLAYELHQEGNGIGASKPGAEITWYMNKHFRLGIERGRRGKGKVFDYTRYSQDYAEPAGVGKRNWSIMDVINQKRTRKQDRPVRVDRLSGWPAIEPIIARV